MEREVGGGIGMGNTCKPMAVSFQCMTKSTTNKKKKKKENWRTNKTQNLREVDWTYISTTMVTNQQSEAAKISKKKKKKKKSNAMFHSLFIHQSFHETACSTNETSVPQAIPS